MKLFDLHCDTLVTLGEKKADFFCPETQFSLCEREKFQRLCQTMAIFVPDQVRGEDAFAYFLKYKDYLDQLLQRQSEVAEKVSCGEDIGRITDQGKCAVILAVESGAALGGKLERVDDLAESGVKVMTLVWNGRNELGSGHDTEEGLTPFGREVIRKMEERRIIVDVSHLNDRGFDEVCEIAEHPFAATHSNLRSICSHPRNLKEEQFCKVIMRRGLVGINLHQQFLSDTGEGKEEDVYRHIDRMLELGGENVIACGSDFDGADIHPSLNTPVKYAKLAEQMLKRGIKEAVVDKIFFENAERFFRENA